MYCIVVPVHVPAATIHIAIEYDFFFLILNFPLCNHPLIIQVAMNACHLELYVSKVLF